MQNPILIDCDGVLADFVASAVAWARTTFPERAHEFTYERVTQFDMLKAWGIPEARPAFDEHARSEGFCSSIKPYPGARDFVEDMRNAGDIIIVTSPYKKAPHWRGERLAWLEEHCGIHEDEVLFTKHKHLIRGASLIDDHLDHVNAYPGSALLLAHPWNMGEITNPNAQRWTGWYAEGVCAS